MKRGETGSYQDTIACGVTYTRFRTGAAAADTCPGSGWLTATGPGNSGDALGRLEGVATLLPDETLFLYAYVRKEAVLSSQIEGTQSSLSDLLLFELHEAPGAPLDDVVEVSNHVAALMKDDAELFKQFMDGEGFKRWLADTAFGLACDRGRIVKKELALMNPAADLLGLSVRGHRLWTEGD